MAKEFHTDVDLKGAVLLDGGAGTAGQVLFSGGPSAPPSWGSPVTVSTSVADLMSTSGGTISAVDPGSDRIWGWDDSQGKAIGFTLGVGMDFDPTFGTSIRSITNIVYTASTRSLTTNTANLGDAVTLPLFGTSGDGLVPASGGVFGEYLRSDGTWEVPPGATNLSYTASTRLLSSDTGNDVTLPLFSSAEPGLTPSSGGGTTNFLRADGTWAAPADGSATDLSYTASTRLLSSSTGTDVTLPLVSSTAAGLAPASGGGTSNFLRADGTWATPSSASGGTKTLAVFTPSNYQPPATLYALLTTTNSIAFLAFDASTEWSANFVGVIPEATVLTSGLTIIIHWRAASGSSGNVRWSVQIERLNHDLDADSFATATEANSAAPATVGVPAVASITTTSLDGLLAGEPFRLRVARKAADATNDTMTGDANVFAVEVRAV